MQDQKQANVEEFSSQQDSVETGDGHQSFQKTKRDIFVALFFYFIIILVFFGVLFVLQQTGSGGNEGSYFRFVVFILGTILDCSVVGHCSHGVVVDIVEGIGE